MTPPHDTPSVRSCSAVAAAGRIEDQRNAASVAAGNYSSHETGPGGLFVATIDHFEAPATTEIAPEDRKGAPRAERESVRTSRCTPWALAAAATAFFSGLTAVHWYPPAAYANDAQYYMHLAQRPLHFTRAPFGFRVLTPWIVWLSHANNRPYVFAAITILSLSAATSLIYLYLLDLYSPRAAMFGAALFAVSPTALIELKNPVDVDALFLAMVVLAFLALMRRRWWLLGVALVVGTLDKEPMLFTLLPVLAVGWLEHRLRPWRRWAALAGVPLLLYFLVHYTPIVFNPVPPNYNYFSVANIEFVFRAQHIINGTSWQIDLLWSVIDTFAGLWLLAVLNFRKAERRVRFASIFMLPVLASVVVATDWPRMLAVGFIVIIPLACVQIRRPVAALALFFSYDALVGLGLDEAKLHVSYSVEVPLIAVSVLAALFVGVDRLPNPAKVVRPAIALVAHLPRPSLPTRREPRRAPVPVPVRAVAPSRPAPRPVSPVRSLPTPLRRSRPVQPAPAPSAARAASPAPATRPLLRPPLLRRPVRPPIPMPPVAARAVAPARAEGPARAPSAPPPPPRPAVPSRAAGASKQAPVPPPPMIRRPAPSPVVPPRERAPLGPRPESVPPERPPKRSPVPAPPPPAPAERLPKRPPVQFPRVPARAAEPPARAPAPQAPEPARPPAARFSGQRPTRPEPAARPPRPQKSPPSPQKSPPGPQKSPPGAPRSVPSAPRSMPERQRAPWRRPKREVPSAPARVEPNRPRTPAPKPAAAAGAATAASVRRAPLAGPAPKPTPGASQPRPALAPRPSSAPVAARSPRTATGAASSERAARPARERSEAVVHLENAQSLLADVQRLVDRARQG
jgi:hypothetical protein